MQGERLCDGVTLYEGDALDVLRSLRANEFDAVVTDPPYGVNTKSDGNGKLSPWADLCNAAHWYAAWLAECRRVLKPSGCVWSCLNWRSQTTFMKASCDIRWPIESMLVWDKRWIGPGGEKGLRPSYELVALFAGPEFAIADRGLPDVQPFPWSAFKPNGHPAEKPVDLMRFCIRHGSPVGGKILDLFAGSGTVGLAALQENRECVLIEQDATWAAAIRGRMRHASGGGSLFGTEAA